MTNEHPDARVNGTAKYAVRSPLWPPPRAC